MLVVNVGNTGITAAVRRAGTGDPAGWEFAPRTTRATPDAAAAQAVLASELAELARAHDVARVAVVSVVPRVTAALLAALPGARACDHTAPLPYALAVVEPAAVGADRYCNAAAAVGAGLRDALVVDMGTATTFDVLRDGVFVGGLIAPGVATAARALGARAARLPEVPPAPSAADPAPDTVGAMAAGSYLAGVHGVIGTVDALQARHGPLPVVLTGGLAPLVADRRGDFATTAAWRIDPDWTLRGAALLRDAMPD